MNNAIFVVATTLAQFYLTLVGVFLAGVVCGGTLFIGIAAILLKVKHVGPNIIDLSFRRPKLPSIRKFKPRAPFVADEAHEKRVFEDEAREVDLNCADCGTWPCVCQSVEKRNQDVTPLPGEWR